MHKGRWAARGVDTREKERKREASTRHEKKSDDDKEEEEEGAKGGRKKTKARAKGVTTNGFSGAGFVDAYIEVRARASKRRVADRSLYNIARARESKDKASLLVYMYLYV